MDPFQLAAQDIPHTVRFRIVIVDPFGPFLQEILVIALVDIDVAAVQLHDRIAHPVKEVTVVRDHEKGAA